MTHDPNEWNPLLPTLDVPEHKPIETGLLDKRGQPIKRHPNAIGFHSPGKVRG